MVVGFPGGPDGQESACNAGDLVRDEPLEKGMATHSSILITIPTVKYENTSTLVCK